MTNVEVVNAVLIFLFMTLLYIQGFLTDKKSEEICYRIDDLYKECKLLYAEKQAQIKKIEKLEKKVNKLEKMAKGNEKEEKQ